MGRRTDGKALGDGAYVDVRQLQQALRDRVDGEIRFDAGSRGAYSTDASNYRQVPIGVVVPRSVEAGAEAIAVCHELRAPVTSRGGGTSLAGQTCNAAVILDWSKYCHRLLSVDASSRTCMVEPGIVLDRLNDQLGPHRLMFGPRPAAHDHCTLGGMIGNNACGATAQAYGKTGDNVEVYGSGGFTSYDAQQQHRQLSDWVHGEGIGRVKIKIGEGGGRRADRDLDRVAAARRTVGADTELFVDPNGAYTRTQAVRVGRTLDRQEVRWFEEPVSSDDLAGLAGVRDALDTEVAAGEYGFDLPYFAWMIPAVDCLQIDVTRCGGFTEFRRAAALAAAHGLEVSGHCAPHQHLPIAAGTANLRHLEWFHDHVRIEGMLLDGAAGAPGGLLRVDPAVPGNGYTFRVADAEPYRVA